MNTQGGLSDIRILLLGWAYTCCFYANQLFTNASTPGGDGIRVLGYAESARASNYFLPLWNPFSAGGHPSLADPDWLFYRLLSPLLNILPRDLYNLNFNLVLLFALLLLTTVIFYLACSINIKKGYAVMAACLFVCSGLGWDSFQWGRIITIIILSSGLALLPLYKSWLYKQGNLALLLLLLSSVSLLIISGYYILMFYGFWFAFAVGCNLKLNKKPSNALFLSAKHLISFGIVTILASAAFLLPLIDSQFNSLVSTQGSGKIYQSTSLSSLSNIFIPGHTIQDRGVSLFPHVSFILVPCLILALLHRSFSISLELKAVMIIGVIYLMLGVGFGLPADVFNRFYSNIPIINLIRWGNVYIQFALLALILSCVAVVNSVDLSNLSLKSKIVVFCSPLLLIVVFIAKDIQALNQNLSFYIPAIISWAIFAAAALLLSFYKSVLVKKLGLIMIIGMGVHLLSPKDFFFKNEVVAVVKRTPNITAWPELTKLYSENIKGVRQYCPGNFFCPLNGSPLIPGVVSFSMYFSAENHTYLEALTNKGIDEKRPHWVGRTPCSILDPVALEMASVRYIFCRGKHKPGSSSWVLKKSAESNKYNQNRRNEKVSLWENPTIIYPAKLFYSQSQKASHDLSPEQMNSLWERGIISLEEGVTTLELTLLNNTEDAISLDKWDEENIVLTISNNSDAILFLSTFFDKGWQATINSKETKIHRAFGSFQAIKLSAGENRIHMQYKPKSWFVGKIITLMTVLGCLIFCFVKRNKKSDLNYINTYN